MGTESKDKGGQSGVQEELSEPLSLAATALGRPSDLRPRTLVPLEHQQAVEVVSQARRHLRGGQFEVAKDLFRQAAALEVQVLRSVKSQPERSLIAEFAVRAALQADRLDLAREFLRRGSPRAPESLHWPLLRASIQVELLAFLDEFGRGWQVPWEPIDDDECRILLVSRGGRRLVFDIDPDASSASEKNSSPDELTFVIPASRPNSAALSTLEASVTHWLGPRRRAQPVLERRGVMDHILMDLVPA